MSASGEEGLHLKYVPYPLSLPLLVTRVLTDDADRAPSLDDLALVADLFDRRSDFHRYDLNQLGEFMPTRAVTNSMLGELGLRRHQDRRSHLPHEERPARCSSSLAGQSSLCTLRDGL